MRVKDLQQLLGFVNPELEVFISPENGVQLQPTRVTVSAGRVIPVIKGVPEYIAEPCCIIEV